jgi:hypothetical protein
MTSRTICIGYAPEATALCEDPARALKNAGVEVRYAPSELLESAALAPAARECNRA